MFSKSDIRAAVVEAIANEDNLMTDGSINWSFVDEEVMFDCNVDIDDDAEVAHFFKLFEEVTAEFRV